MKLLLIRHGQSANNALAGNHLPVDSQFPDPELTELGQRQAGLLAKAFHDELLPHPSVLLCSPMTRAVQTCAPLADELDLPIQLETQAHEVGGIFQGVQRTPGAYLGASRGELAGISDRLVFNDDIRDEGWYRMGSQVETPSEGQGRGKRLYRSILERYGNTDGIVALVCHEWISNYLIRASLGLTDPEGEPDPWFSIANTGTTFIQTGLPLPGPYEGGGTAMIWWIGRFDHLPAEQLSR